MSLNFDLNAILGQMGRDKGIDKQVLVEAVESAMLSAARKHFGHNLNLESKMNPDTGEVEVVQFKVVVDTVEDPDTQISLDEARAGDPEAMVGEELGKKLDTVVLGRIAAQTAKQVIMQKVRDAERGVIFEEYKDSKGELINGIVLRAERGNIVVNLGRTEAILPRREQIQREKYRPGDRLRGMILDVDRSARGPQIILTRSHPDFLRKLFELEVPEIAEGTIELKAVAREPGERAKIAVHSSDSSIDPVGACVGIKGSRVQAVVQELRGERIDIITWTPDEPSFVARALAPAEVSRVVVEEEQHSMEVVVPDDQLSLAIGRRGQNVKLASKVTGWRIDVRSVSVAEEESKRIREVLASIPGIDFMHAEILFQQGFRSVRDVADATLEDFEDIEGLDQSEATEIIAKAKEHLVTLGDEGLEGDGVETEDAVYSDLDRLAIPVDVRDLLVAAKFSTIQRLIEADDDVLSAVDGIGERDVAAVREAIEKFLRGGIGAQRESVS
jgi:N utilization substance protein A